MSDRSGTGPDLERFFASADEARSCAVFTGAGVSAESGVPTFRGKEGMWKDFKAEELATPEAFERDPDRVLEWYAWRREKIADIEPNPGHEALARAEERFEEFTLITQNIDGLHEQAGSRDVIELHGNILRDRCHVCGSRRGPGEDGPRCTCGGRYRPDVVWFGEMLPQQALERAFQAARSADVFLSVGTSTLVYPAAYLPFMAHEAGAFTVEVNPERTPFSDQADLVLRGASGSWLPRLFPREG
ncbi:MAG: NAD-dependent deacylase [bacterium]